MIDPIAVGQTKEFIAEEDLNTKSPTIWFVGPLDSMEKQRILSTNLNISEDDEGNPVVKKKESAISDFAIIKHGLKGWKNFGDVEFKTEKVKLFDREVDVVSDDLIKKIPLFVIYQLSNAIWGENQVSEKLAKN